MSLSRTTFPTRSNAPAALMSTGVVSRVDELPVALDDVKAFLKVEYSGEDALIEDLIRGAAERIESLCQVALIEQTVRARFLGPATYGHLPRAPVDSVTAAEVIRQGTGSKTDVTGQILAEPVGRFYRNGQALIGAGEALEVTFKAGYLIGDGTTQATARQDAVPHALRHALLLSASDAHQHRGAEVVGTVVARLSQDARSVLAEAGFLSYSV